MRPIITLTTDFGLDDPFVGIMKEVILNLAPDAQIVGITHNIEPKNITQDALILNATYPWFPRKTIHVVVVDPGIEGEKKVPARLPQKKVGGPGPVTRRAMAVQSKPQTFVGPDNGCLPLPFIRKPGFIRSPTKNISLKTSPTPFMDTMYLLRVQGGLPAASSIPKWDREC